MQPMQREHQTPAGHRPRHSNSIRRGKWIILSRLLPALLLPTLTFAAPVTVEIVGVEKQLEQNIRARLTITQEDDTAAPERIRYAHELARTEIGEALEPFGYYRPVIEARLQQEDAGWHVRYQIEPGTPLRLTKVDVRLLGEGADTPELQPLVTHYPLHVGDRLDQPVYENSKRLWQNRATELGFFDARFSEHQLRVNAEDNSAELSLHLETGPRYRYAAIEFDQTPLNPDLLQRFGQFNSGEPYQAASLLELQKNLLNSGYFSRADVTPQLDRRKDGEVPVRIELGMSAKNRYQAGAGYGADTGPRLTLGYRNRYINRYGHSFQSTLRLSMIRSDLDALYAIPLQDPVKEQLGFTAQFRTENTEAGNAKLEVGGIRRSVARFGLREVLSLDFHRETYDIGGARTAFLVLPGISYTWLQTDNTLDTHEGIRLNLAATGASTAVLSDATFVKFLFNAKGVHSFWDKNRLIARGQMGYIVSDSFDQIPLTQRFYAGGNNSIRGYRLNEVGPLNHLNQHTGGHYLTTASLEYERTLFGAWGVALFYDVGSAANHFNVTPAQGAGIGVRWRSPFGPVKLDVATPLVGGQDPFQVYFMVGPEL